MSHGMDGDTMVTGTFRKWVDRRWGGSLLGWLGERLAAQYLRRRGLRVLAKNVRCGRGEIDLVAIDGHTLVFVEVKSRSQRSWSADLDKLDRRKRKSLRRACRYYLSSIGWNVEAYRVDAVSVDFLVRGFFPRVVDIRWSQGVLDLDS